MLIFILLYFLGLKEIPWYVQLPTVAASTVITCMLNDQG